MKTFLVDYNSPCNLFKGKLAISAKSIQSAQAQFLDWLEKQETYNHLWELHFKFEEIGGL